MPRVGAPWFRVYPRRPVPSQISRSAAAARASEVPISWQAANDEPMEFPRFRPLPAGSADEGSRDPSLRPLPCYRSLVPLLGAEALDAGAAERRAAWRGRPGRGWARRRLRPGRGPLLLAVIAVFGAVGLLAAVLRLILIGGTQVAAFSAAPAGQAVSVPIAAAAAPLPNARPGTGILEAALSDGARPTAAYPVAEATPVPPGGQAEAADRAASAPNASAAPPSPPGAMGEDPSESVAALAARAEQQLAAARVSSPPGDNALESYRRMVQMAPADPAVAKLRDRIRSASLDRARAAAEARDWSAALQFYEAVMELDAVEPASGLLAEDKPEAATSPSQGSAPTPGPLESAQGDPKQAGGGSGSPTPDAPMSAPQTAAAGPAPAALPPAAEPAVSKELIEALVKRGDAMLAIGDISAARLLYERAAAAGDGRAATSAGKTYDPQFLTQAGARSVPGDAKAAAEWYRRAIALGDAEAAERIKTLPPR